MLPRQRVYRYPPGRNMQDVPLPGVAGGIMSVPYDMGGMPIRDAVAQPMPIQALATALANAPPEQQRTVSPISFYCLSTFGLSSYRGLCALRWLCHIVVLNSLSHLWRARCLGKLYTRW